MPITRQSERRLEMAANDVETYKRRMKNEFNNAVDEILDHEMNEYCQRTGRNRQQNPGFNFSSYIRGLYYLTLAKYFNPLAYRMAWQVLKKLHEKQEQDEGRVRSDDDDDDQQDEELHEQDLH